MSGSVLESGVAFIDQFERTMLVFVPSGKGKSSLISTWQNLISKNTIINVALFNISTIEYPLGLVNEGSGYI